jgi:hypothetical protein
VDPTAGFYMVTVRSDLWVASGGTRWVGTLLANAVAQWDGSGGCRQERGETMRERIEVDEFEMLDVNLTVETSMMD